MNERETTLCNKIGSHPLDGTAGDGRFVARLAHENGWSRSHADRVVAEYRRFLFLAVAAGHEVSPSDAVDQAWHQHLCNTRDYWERFCPQVLGRPLHHEPGGDARRLGQAYAQTLGSYRAFFGSEPPADIWPPPARRCQETRSFRRVDTRSVWLVPRPGRAPLLALAAATLLPACDLAPLSLLGFGLVAVVTLVLGLHDRAEQAGARRRRGAGGGYYGGTEGGWAAAGGKDGCDPATGDCADSGAGASQGGGWGAGDGGGGAAVGGGGGGGGGGDGGGGSGCGAGGGGGGCGGGGCGGS